MQSISLTTSTLLHILIYSVFLIVIDSSISLNGIAFGSLLIWVSVVDTDKFEIPDLAILLLILIGLSRLIGVPLHEAVNLLLGAILWPLMFWAVAKLYLRNRGFHGLGFGDVKLISAIGLWCGFLATVHVVLAAALSGILLLVLRTTIYRKSITDLNQSMVAFGPFLCLCAWVIWLSGAYQ